MPKERIIINRYNPPRKEMDNKYSKLGGLIGFCGRKRSGKSTMAQICANECNGVVHSFATPLKLLVQRILGINEATLSIKKEENTPIEGVRTERIVDIINESTGISQKQIIEVLKQSTLNTVRDYLQVIGTDIIRKYDKDWHVREAMKLIITSMRNGVDVFVDDVRFQNEKNAIEDNNGECFFIVRPDCSEISNHASEVDLTWSMFDYGHIIINDRNIEDISPELIRRVLLNNSLTVEDRIKCGGYTPPSDASYGTDITDPHVKRMVSNIAIGSYGGYCSMNIPVETLEEAVEILDKCKGTFKKTKQYGTYIGYVQINDPLVIENVKLNIKA